MNNLYAIIHFPREREAGLLPTHFKAEVPEFGYDDEYDREWTRAEIQKLYTMLGGEPCVVQFSDELEGAQ